MSFYEKFLGNEVMNDSDRLLLSPWQKWTKYHRFPMKVLLQVILLALIFTQIYYFSSYTPAYSRSIRSTFDYFFLPQRNLYTVDDMVNHLNLTQYNYYNINNVSLYNFGYNYVNETTISPVLLTVTYLNQSRQDYYLTLNDPYGPFVGSYSNIKKLFSSVVMMVKSFELCVDEMWEANTLVKTKWTTTVIYKLDAGRVLTSLQSYKTTVDDTIWRDQGWLSITLIILTILSIGLSFKRIYQGVLIYKRCKSDYELIPDDVLLDYFEKTRIRPVCKKWEDIPFKVKFEFFSSWHVWSMFGDLAILVGSALRLYGDMGKQVEVYSRLFFGIGTFILCVNATKYLEYSLDFYTLILTLRVAFKKLLRSFVSTLPLFVGYILCGLIVFAPYSSMFSDLDTTAMSLFALINGDNIFFTFDHLATNYPIMPFTRIYLYTFVLLFLAAVLNIFIFIIEESFHLAKVLSLRNTNNPGDLDHDSLLLWEALQHTFTVSTLFDILDKCQQPNIVNNNMSPNQPLLPKQIKIKERITKETIMKILETHTLKLQSDTSREYNLKQVQYLDNVWKELQDYDF